MENLGDWLILLCIVNTFMPLINAMVLLHIMECIEEIKESKK